MNVMLLLRTVEKRSSLRMTVPASITDKPRLRKADGAKQGFGWVGSECITAIKKEVD